MFRALIISVAALLALPSIAAAQTVTVTGPNTVNPAGQPTAVAKTFVVNADGSIASSSVAQGSTTAGQAGALDQCAVVAGDAVYTAGTTQPLNCTASGRLKVGLSSATNVVPAALPTTTTQASLLACRYVAAPPAWTDGWTGAVGCDGAGSVRTSETPSATTTSALAPVAGSLVSAVVGKAAPGNMYGVEITTAATAGYLYVFNATAAPADGAVVAGGASGNYQYCAPVAAATRLSSPYDTPESFSVGITAVFSTTACGTLTKSATPVFIKVRAK